MLQIFTDILTKSLNAPMSVQFMFDTMSERTLITVATLLLAVLVSSTAAKVRYDNYQVVRVNVADLEGAKALNELKSTKFDLDFWTDIRIGGPVDIMVHKDDADFYQFLKTKSLRSNVMIQDVQALIDEEAAKMAEIEKKKAMQRNYKMYKMDWDTYHPLEDFYEYFDFIAANNDDASVESIGMSYEGQDMRVLKICRGGCGSKPAMFVEGGIHAREWISPAAVMYIAKQLTEGLTDDNQNLVDNLDWYILPSVNPDGYRYTNGTDRLWRKTRSDHGSTFGCLGADPNRNWDWYFGGAGTSDSKCSDIYHGPEAFSEVEVANVRDFLNKNNANGNIKFFNDVHSYSQLILLSPGWETNQKPEGHEQRLAFANEANDALYQVHNKKYTVGSIVDVLYAASGGSLDWTLMVADIPYSIAMELRDTGEFGFILPTEQITPTSEEVWAFHVSAGQQIIEEFGKAQK